MARLAGLTDTLTYLGMGAPGESPTRDTLLYLLIDLATEAFRRDIARHIYPREHFTEYVDIENRQQDYFHTSQFPVVHIDAITDDTTLVATTDYYLPESIVRDGETHNAGIVQLDEGALAGMYWPRSRQQIRIMYLAGYSAVPMDVQLGIMEEVKMLYYRQTYGEMASEKIGEYSYTLVQHSGGHAPAYQEAVRRYRRMEAF